MPSFLNKVFGYKKNDDKQVAHPAREASDSTLLDGKYEAILSPSASTFAEAQSTRDSDRDAVFSLFKPKFRGFSQKSAQKRPEAVPYLTLQLPGPKEYSDSRAFGVVFEADPDSQTILDDAVIAAKRFNPLEALILVRACTQTITERGLETLGIMHPHWFSASPDVQRKLISLFIRSLTPPNKVTTLSPTLTAPLSAFENELHYTRSPHDVAAVLRWGLRHLQLENGGFGKDGAEWAWYNAFFHAERDASYPSKGFSELLLPQLPASHVELLVATLGLVSSLASHAESNGISGSKLSKFLGFWLLAGTRAEPYDDWDRFYARWERAGRILEHLFLARLREESFGQRLPTRLQELVKYYPYNKSSPAAEDGILSRPRFSTHQYDALFVRVDALLTHSSEQPKQHPIQLLIEAFQLPTENLSGDDHVPLWNTLKTTALEEATSSNPEGLQFTRIFVDETIQLLSLIPAGGSVSTSPILLTSPTTKVVSLERSSSFTRILERSTPRSNDEPTPVSPTSPSSAVITDWAQFSLSGFGGSPATQPLAALLDQDDDIEVTQPQTSPKSSRRDGKSHTRRRRSEDHERPETPPSSQSKPELSVLETKLASVQVIQIDEAFVDFWSDAIVDPVSANWPTFVVCGLKPIPGAEPSIRWLVIEQTYSRQELQPPRPPSPDGPRGRSPRPSFKSDISGFRINTMFSTARKRLSAFSKSATDLDPRKSGARTPVAGEFGEVLVEEEPAILPALPTKADHHFDGNVAVGAAVISGVTANVADQLKVDDITVSTAGIPTADLVSVEPDLVEVAAKASPTEPSPQTGDIFSAASVKTKEAVSVEQGSLPTLDVINPKPNAADPVAKIAPLATDTFDSRPTQDASGYVLPALGPVPTAEISVIEEVQTRAGHVRQSIATVETKNRATEFVVRLADDDQTEPTGEPSNVAEVEVVNPAPETVPVALVTPTDETTAEHVTEEVGVVRKAPTELVAADTVKSIGQHAMDDLPPVSTQDVTPIETATQLDANSVISTVDGVKEVLEVAELVENPTPAAEVLAVLVEETALQQVSVDAHPDAVPTESDRFEHVPPQPGAAELSQAPLKAEEESAVYPVEEPPVEIIPAVDTTAQSVVLETEHAADQVLERATEEDVQPLLRGTIAQAQLVEVVPVAHISTVQDPTHAEVEAQVAHERQSHVSETRIDEAPDAGAPTPVPEHTALDDETPDAEVVAEACEPVEVAPAVIQHEVVDDMPELFVGTVLEAQTPPTDVIPPVEVVQPLIETELSAQFADTQSEDSVPTEFIPERATVVLATADEIDHKAVDTLESEIKDALEVAVETRAPAQLAPSTPELVVEPVTEEARDVALSACEPGVVTASVIIEEPVAQDVQVDIVNPSSEAVPQPLVEAANPVVVAVSVPETDAVEEEVQPEVHVTHPAVDAIDGTQEAAEPVPPPAPEVDIKDRTAAEEIRSGEPEALVAEPEPEPVEVGAPAPVVEEVQVPVEEGEPCPVAVKGTEAYQPEGELNAAPAVEIDETHTHGVDGPQEVSDLTEQPVGVDIDEPAGRLEDAPTES